MIFGKSSFATGDLFGTKKVLERYEQSSIPAAKDTEVLSYSPAISQLKQENGVIKFTNRFSKTPNQAHKKGADKTLDTTSKG